MGDVGIYKTIVGESPHRPVTPSPIHRMGLGGLNEQEEQSNSTKQFIL